MTHHLLLKKIKTNQVFSRHKNTPWASTVPQGYKSCCHLIVARLNNKFTDGRLLKERCKNIKLFEKVQTNSKS